MRVTVHSISPLTQNSVGVLLIFPMFFEFAILIYCSTLLLYTIPHLMKSRARNFTASPCDCKVVFGIELSSLQVC